MIFHFVQICHWWKRDLEVNISIEQKSKMRLLNCLTGARQSRQLRHMVPKVHIGRSSRATRVVSLGWLKAPKGKKLLQWKGEYRGQKTGTEASLDIVHKTGGFHVVIWKFQLKGSKLQTDHIHRGDLLVSLFTFNDLRPDATPYCTSSVKSGALHT